MESESIDAPLVVIVGQTGSGKSALALDLAERWNSEIIAADSRTVYRDMDIGTAKPSMADRQRVPHHLIDVCNVDDPFAVNDFQRLARQAVTDITARGAIPFLVGGAGLYVDALLFGFGFRGGPEREQRTALSSLSVDELQERLISKGVSLPANERNPRHLIRAIESGGASAFSHELRANTLIIGLDIEKSLLKEYITQRVDVMLHAGLEREVITLADRYGWQCPPMQTIGYQEFKVYDAGEATIEEVRQAIITHTMQYAKRQKTWFRRNKSIHWISKAEEVVDLLTTFLNK